VAGTADLVDRVRALRAEGLTPKEIARAVGARPGEVTAIVRRIAAEATAGGPALVGCWVGRGWSTALTVAGHPEWPDEPVEAGLDGLVCVLVARRHRPRRLSVCGYLLDTYCLGLKNTLGPELMRDDDLAEFQEMFFPAGAPPLEVPLALVRDLVFGAVDYARGLGFEPHPDLAHTAEHLGEPWTGPSAITFGRDGRPFYVDGPDDNPAAVLRTLAAAVGEGGFDHLSLR
jgi:hypothetical protein